MHALCGESDRSSYSLPRLLQLPQQLLLCRQVWVLTGVLSLFCTQVMTLLGSITALK